MTWKGKKTRRGEMENITSGIMKRRGKMEEKDVMWQ